MNHSNQRQIPTSPPALEPLTPRVFLQLDKVAPRGFPELKIEGPPPLATLTSESKPLASTNHSQSKADSFTSSPISGFSTPSESSCSYLVEHLPPEIVQRRGSDSNLSSVFSTTTMDELTGVAMLVSGHHCICQVLN